jgi:hypothetical protein
MSKNHKWVPWENNWMQTNNFSKAVNIAKLQTQRILNVDMTRDRDLQRVKKNLPTLAAFIDKAIKKWSKHIYDLWSWKWILADDIQDLYNQNRIENDYIRVQRIDILPWEERKTSRSIPLWWRINWKIDIQDLMGWLNNAYSIFCIQYIQNAPDMIEHLRKNLRPWCSSYIQFPKWLRTKKLLNEFIQDNKDKNILVYADDTNPSFGSIIFETRKTSEQDTSLKIPKYKSETNIPLYRTADGKKVHNSEFFYHFFAENDPEREELQNIKPLENVWFQW